MGVHRLHVDIPAHASPTPSPPPASPRKPEDDILPIDAANSSASYQSTDVNYVHAMASGAELDDSATLCAAQSARLGFGVRKSAVKGFDLEDAIPGEIGKSHMLGAG